LKNKLSPIRNRGYSDFLFFTSLWG